MLPRRHRLRSRSDFTAVMRRHGGGYRLARPLFVLHLDLASMPRTGAGGAPRVGLIVSRAVGGSVQRNRVKRRLRAGLAGGVAQLPAQSRLVVRALPGISAVSGPELARQIDSGLAALLRKVAK